jgi:hypothetical protein
MRGLKQLRTTRVISTGHAFVQNIRRGHYEFGLDVDPKNRLSTAFTELWRAPASVDSHRSGTMVYEEKNRSGIDTPEVHR